MPYYLVVVLKGQEIESRSSPIATLDAARDFARGLETLGDTVLWIEDGVGKQLAEDTEVSRG